MNFRSYLPKNNGVNSPITEEEYQAVCLVFIKCGTRFIRKDGEQWVDCRYLDEHLLQRNWQKYFEDARKIVAERA